MVRWIETNYRLGKGDYYGQPLRLTSYQKRWIYRLGEYYPETGLNRYKRAGFGTAKGNGKTPFEGAVGAEGLAGPTASIDPLVLVAAASLGQSNLVHGDLKIGITHDDSPMKPFVVPLELTVQLKDGSGEAKRIAAAEGTNDGPRATRLLCDELHEWTGKMANVFTILDGSIGKRENAYTVWISTAGSSQSTLLNQQVSRGKQLASGEIIDDATLFEWYEIPEEMEVPERIRTDLDLEQWMAAVLWANPALAESDFLKWDYIRSRFDGAQTIERFKWFRYHGNRQTRSESRWLPPGKWADCLRLNTNVMPGDSVVLAFSGTYDRDSAGLVACFPDGMVKRLGSWEPKDENDNLYEVPTDEVHAAVRAAMAEYRISRFVCNPNGWHGEIQAWTSAYGARTVALFDWTHQIKRKHDACSKFFTAVLTQAIGHDGDGALARHLDSATLKETVEGAWITSAGRSGPPIALAVAAVMAYDQMSSRPARKRGGFAGVTV